MRKGNSDLVDIACEIVKDVPGKAAIAIIDGTLEKFRDHAGEERQRPKWFWLPRSQIEISPDRKTVTVPEWLAVEKELV